MNPIETLGLALGAGFSSGLNLYATVATLGLLQRFGVLRLPPGLQALAHPLVLGIAIALYLLEFLADKIPYFDTVWDAVHTFIRPPAAAILAYAAASGAAPEWRLRAAPFSASSQRNCATLGKAVISNTRQANPKTSCTKTARSAASAPSGLRREKRPASTALPAVAAR